MRIMNNISAMNAHRLYTANNSKLSKSLEKLSSGYAINRAGDNAAGLAVSEKMRAQIAGLEQASKNAQDGISMVQTYEGALTETDSILQRMRSLAVQSANGNYDNSVDRVAIEQEFKQLNDELDQIADTDFNGVIVLNGGKMADGLEAVDGVFDYKNKAGQIDAANAEKLAEAQAKAQEAIDAAQTAVDDALKGVTDAENALNAAPKDLSNNGSAAEWNTVDNSTYTNELAEKLFGAALSTPNTEAVDRSAGGAADGWEGLDSQKYTADAAEDLFDNLETADGKSLSDAAAVSAKVTFTYDKENDTWVASSATAKDADGNEIEVANAEQTFGTENVDGGATVTGKGGFKIKNGTTEIANAIFDTTDLNDGDTITLEFTSPLASTAVAPANLGIDGTVTKNFAAAPTGQGGDVTVSTTLTNATMTEKAQAALEELNGYTFELAFTAADGTATLSWKDADGNAVATPTNFDATWDKATGEITIKDKSATPVTVATIAVETTGLTIANNDTLSAKIAVSTNNFEAGSNSVAINVESSDTLEASKPLTDATSMDVTFTAKVDENGNVTWEATSGTATNKDGSTNGIENLDDLFSTTTVADGNGGFTVENADGDTLANAVFDASNVKNGDTVTLTFTYSSQANDAPDNVGFAENSVDKSGVTLATTTATLGDPTITKEAALTDANMSEEVKTALDALQGAKINAIYDGASGTAASFSIGEGKDEVALTNGAKFEFNGVTMWAEFTGGALTISSAKLNETDGTYSKGTELFEFTAGAASAGNATGKATAEIRFDNYSYDPNLASSTVTVGADKNLSSEGGATAALENALKGAQDAHAAALEKLNAAKEAYPTELGDVDDYSVSKSDAFNQSATKLTYADGMSLQVGARTKDLVDFTFSYDAEAIGDLEADLNCTSEGLGTKSLSLATQESANAAIDKIDHAINKISMVRGTFGAIQNRLEHKISNLDTNNENLTAAESRIRDTDMAAEMMEFTKNQILSQASQSMLAQANQLPQGVLSLLQ